MQLSKFEQRLSELITKYNLQYDENRKLKETIRKRNLMIKQLRKENIELEKRFKNELAKDA